MKTADQKILDIIERFNYSPQTIGYAALTAELQRFYIETLQEGIQVALDVIKTKLHTPSEITTQLTIMADAHKRYLTIGRSVDENNCH